MPSSSFRQFILFSLCIIWFSGVRAEPAEPDTAPVAPAPDYEAAPFILSSESLGSALGGQG